MKNDFTKLFVDDTRETPEGWDRAYTAWEALFKLELLQYQEVSLDHDLASFLGYREITGYDIAVWLADRKQNGKYVPPVIKVHSANTPGHENIQAVIDRYLK